MICHLDLVVVLWTDAFDSTNGWVDLDSYKPEPQVVVTVGYVLPDLLAGHLSLTSSFSPKDNPLTDCGMISHIPNEMIRQFTVLQVATSRE